MPSQRGADSASDRYTSASTMAELARPPAMTAIWRMLGDLHRRGRAQHHGA
jgi:hypothetical protein